MTAAARGADLDLRGVSLAYDRRQVLHDVGARLGAGERAALLGPNGAGKSSLLRCITGLVRYDGAVLVDGQPIEELSRQTMARTMAVVPGQTAIYFPTRVEEVVALGRIPHEHPLLGPRAADSAAVESAVDRVGIRHLVGRDVRHLSLGERQLVVLAMTIAQGARLLLLDEPTVHLDLGHQVRTMDLLRELSEHDGVTVVAVLHDVMLASHFFDRLLLLDHGRLVADGAPSAVLTPERVRDVYEIDPRVVGLGAGVPS